MDKREIDAERQEELELLADKYCELIARVNHRLGALSLETRSIHTRNLLIKLLEETGVLPGVHPPLPTDIQTD